MRLAFCFVLVALLSGCATTSDPIQRLVADLSASHGTWQNGISPNLHLPATAPPEQVIKTVLQMTSSGNQPAEPCTVLEMRQVQIEGDLTSSYTAALVQTDLGEKIVLFEYLPRVGWWSRVYDAKAN